MGKSAINIVKWYRCLRGADAMLLKIKEEKK